MNVNVTHFNRVAISNINVTITHHNAVLGLSVSSFTLFLVGFLLAIPLKQTLIYRTY